MIVKMDPMNQVHVHRDDVQHNNFNVEIKIVHQFHMFVMVGNDFPCEIIIYVIFFVNRRG
jgi:hypothetical protein